VAAALAAIMEVVVVAVVSYYLKQYQLHPELHMQLLWVQVVQQLPKVEILYSIASLHTVAALAVSMKQTVATAAQVEAEVVLEQVALKQAVQVLLVPLDKGMTVAYRSGKTQ
jgi:hypothetical protein